MKLFSYKNNDGRKSKMRPHFLIYLMCLFMATLLSTGVSFSKFATTKFDKDEARVALMAIDAGSILDLEFNGAPGETEEVTFASVYKGIHDKTTKYGLPTY